MATSSEITATNKYMDIAIKKKFVTTNIIPPFMFSALAAEKWVMKKLHMYQVAPCLMEHNRLLIAYLDIVIGMYPNMASAHLLYALICQRTFDHQKAIKSLYDFVTFSQVNFFDNLEKKMPRASDSLSTIDRVASLLAGRLYRMQKNYDKAADHLEDSISLAQMHKDDEILQMAVAEIRIFQLEAARHLKKYPRFDVYADKIMAVQGEEEQWFSDDDVNEGVTLQNVEVNEELGSEMMTSEEDSRGQLGNRGDTNSITHASLTANTMISHVASNQPSTSVLDDPTKSTSLFFNPLEHNRQAECTNFVNILVNVMRNVLSGNPTNCEIISTHQSSDWTRLNDPHGYTRIHLDTATAIKSSVLLLHGHGKQVEQLAHVMKETNVGDNVSPRHDTEPYAVLRANEAYALALDGKWQAAGSCIRRTLRRFLDNSHPECLNHLKLCQALIYTDQALFCGELEKASEHLMNVERYEKFEYTIRSATILAANGRLLEGIEKLENFEPNLLTEVRTIERIRFLTVLGGFYAIHRDFLKAEYALRKAHRFATHSTAKPLIWMTTRRLAFALIEQKKYDEALIFLRTVNDDELRGIERVLFAGTMAHLYLNQNEKDPKSIIEWLCKFIQEAKKFGMTLWVKEGLRLSVHFYQFMKNFDARNAAAAALLRLDEKFPHKLDWKLF